MTLKTSNNKYGASILVTDKPFIQPRIIFAVAPTADAALSACLSEAKKGNWTPPAWWQWWRRKDSKTPYVSELL